MSESLILSSIFIGIIALIAFIGATFGIARGFLATASILIGAELALWWGNNLGDRLSDLVDISRATGHFLSGMLLLVLTVLLLGVGASNVLSWGTPTRWGAFLGAALGAANGALLIAMALRLYYLAYSGRLTSLPLNDSLVTRILWRNFDWFILGFTVAASALLLYTRMARLQTTIPDPSARASFSRPIPPPVPRVTAPPGHAVNGTQRPVPGPAANGAEPTSSGPSVDERIFAPPPRDAALQGQVLERSTVVEVAETRTELPSTRNTVRFCPNCGMTLDSSDRFCPDCGYTL